MDLGEYYMQQNSLLADPIPPLLDLIADSSWDKIRDLIIERFPEGVSSNIDDPTTAGIIPHLVLHKLINPSNTDVSYLCNRFSNLITHCENLLTLDLSIFTDQRLSSPPDASTFNELPLFLKAEALFKEFVAVSRFVSTAKEYISLDTLSSLAPISTSFPHQAAFIVASTARTFPYPSVLSVPVFAKVLGYIDICMDKWALTTAWVSNAPHLQDQIVNCFLSDYMYLPVVRFLSFLSNSNKISIFQKATLSPTPVSIATALSCTATPRDVDLFLKFLLAYPQNISKIASSFTPKSNIHFVPKIIEATRRALLHDLNSKVLIDSGDLSPSSATCLSICLGLYKPLPKPFEIKQFLSMIDASQFDQVVVQNPQSLLIPLLSILPFGQCSDSQNLIVKSFFQDQVVPFTQHYIQSNHLPVNYISLLCLVGIVSSAEKPKKFEILFNKLVTLLTGVEIKALVGGALIFSCLLFNSISRDLTSFIWNLDPAAFLVQCRSQQLGIWLELVDVLFNVSDLHQLNLQKGYEFFENFGQKCEIFTNPHTRIKSSHRLAFVAMRLGQAAGKAKLPPFNFSLLTKYCSFIGYNNNVSNDELTPISKVLLQYCTILLCLCFSYCAEAVEVEIPLKHAELLLTLPIHSISSLLISFDLKKLDQMFLRCVKLFIPLNSFVYKAELFLNSPFTLGFDFSFKLLNVNVLKPTRDHFPALLSTLLSFNYPLSAQYLEQLVQLITPFIDKNNVLSISSLLFVFLSKYTLCFHSKHLSLILSRLFDESFTSIEDFLGRFILNPHHFTLDCFTDFITFVLYCFCERTSLRVDPKSFKLTSNEAHSLYLGVFRQLLTSAISLPNSFKLLSLLSKGGPVIGQLIPVSQALNYYALKESFLLKDMVKRPLPLNVVSFLVYSIPSIKHELAFMKEFFINISHSIKNHAEVCSVLQSLSAMVFNIDYFYFNPSTSDFVFFVVDYCYYCLLVTEGSQIHPTQSIYKTLEVLPLKYLDPLLSVVVGCLPLASKSFKLEFVRDVTISFLNLIRFSQKVSEEVKRNGEISLAELGGSPTLKLLKNADQLFNSCR
ncbi:hypothetical protein P9112_004119 [Eukaryota sp. TZLM1-RC]